MTVAPAWVEAHCVVPDGFRKGEPFRLYEYQLLYLANFYLVRGDVRWIPEHPVLASAFVHRRGLLVGPQKLGKNPKIAAQICLEARGPALFAGWAGVDDGYVCVDFGCPCGWEYPYEPGEPMGMVWPQALIQITAFSEEATQNTYDALRPMIELGPLSDVIPKTGEDFIRLPNDGRIDTVTSSALSRLGQRVTFAPQDEVGVWTRENKMEKVADTQYRGLAGMGGRASLTTNAWDPAEHSVAQREYESGATDVYRQFVRPPKTLSFANKAERRKILRIVYPEDTRRENGGHAELESIEAEAADIIAKGDLPQAERFYGNILVPGAGKAVDPEAWDALAVSREIAPGARIGLGFDGSISGDATILRGCTADGYGFLLGAWVRPTDPPALKAWLEEHGPAEDWYVVRSDVHAAVREAFKTYKVGRMLCDPPKWRTEVEEWARLYGKEVVLAFDTFAPTRFGPAVGRWRDAIATGAYHHDDDPITADHVKAAHLSKVKEASDDTDGRTQYVIKKGADRRKIDAAVADILAYEAAMTMPPEQKVDRTVYSWT